MLIGWAILTVRLLARLLLISLPLTDNERLAGGIDKLNEVDKSTTLGGLAIKQALSKQNTQRLRNGKTSRF